MAARVWRITISLITLALIRSNCLFWFSISEPMSMAMLRKLPIIVLTWVIFSSISPSRASLLILLREKTKPHNVTRRQFHSQSPSKQLEWRTLRREGRRVRVLLGNITACWTDSIAVIHNSGWLVVDYFAIVVAFPRPFVFLELRRSGKRLNK